MDNRWMPVSGTRVIPKGQPSRMTCWLTAYEMLFNSGGENLSQSDIENLLEKGGFNVDQAKSGGLSDEDFVKASEILGTGSMYPGCLWTINGVQSKLQMYGVLWVALFVCPDTSKPRERYHHIINVLGVDIKYNQVGIVNPWKQTIVDSPSVAWVDWSWFRDGLPGTESVLAGCQYYQPPRIAARTYEQR